MSFIIDILSASWAILEDSAIFLLGGFFLAGLIKVFLPLDFVKRKLGGNGAGSVVNAALIGIPLPLCSCSVIPTAVSLRSSGASKGATSAFLISTPESGVDSIAITYALLDPLMTIFRPMAALVTAIFAGIMENIFGDRLNDNPGPKTDDLCGDDCHSSSCQTRKEAKVERPTLFSRFSEAGNFAFVDLMDDLAGWLAVGILAAGVVSAMIPEGFLDRYAGQGFWTMLVMLAAGVPMYICATASTPLAAALMLKGLSPGAALVFLLSGPATNISTIIIIRKFMGGRSLAIYLAAIAVGSITAGLALNWLYIALGVDASATLGQATRIFPWQAELAAALIFMVLAGRSLLSWAMGGLVAAPNGGKA
ncbi:MAG: SO_0444 family Cu/Zn efflux transporter [Nitrospinota bacterium]|nr:SO_0444 family Cu/Zn efflux transporter [Nitrospinota bacterium]